MPAPEQLYIQFDGTTPEISRTMDFSGESKVKKSNEYNISVFQSDGFPALGTVSGVITGDFYSPGADRPEQATTTVDLPTGCRKFTLFVATISRAVFSVSGLAVGNKVTIEAIRSEP